MPYHVCCFLDTGHCRNNPCTNGGTCTAFTDYYRCHCPVGFKGFHCEGEDIIHNEYTAYTENSIFIKPYLSLY